MYNFTEHHYILAITCSAVSYGITQVCKPFWKSYFQDKEKAKGITKLCSVISGAIVGFTLTYQIVDLWLGASMGAFNSLVIALLKKKLGVKDEQREST